VGVLLAVYFAVVRGSGLLDDTAAQLRERLEPVGLATPAGFLALAAFYCIAHSFLEEYYWRWFVFGRLREQTRPVVAGLMASLGFTAHHVILLHRLTGGSWGPVVLLSLGVTAGGVVWAWLYHRTRSIYGPWWSHAIVDAGLMAVGYDLLWRIP